VVDIEGLWPVRARNPSIKALAEAGVVRQISEGSYNRQFAALELFDLVTAYEARIAGRPRGS
jgi:hypothetical protein